MVSTKTHSKISFAKVEAIIADLAKWATGGVGDKLTWAILEERHGFSRQAMQAKPDVKAAYLVAKKNLSGGRAELKMKEAVSALVQEERLELERLRQKVCEYERKETMWKLRWQRIAYHVRSRGMQISKVDIPIPPGAPAPSERTTAEILQLFDKEIPPSGQI